MDEWKEAARLTFYEIKVSWAGFLYSFIWTLFLLVILNSKLVENVREHIIMTDLLFIIFFTSIGFVAKMEFKRKSEKNRYEAANQFHMFLTLPIDRSVVAKRQFIIWLARTVFFQALFCLLLYWFVPELREWLSPFSYVAFSILWLAFGLIVGALMTAFDISTDRDTARQIVAVLLSLCTMFVVFFVLVLIVSYSRQSLLYWTIHIANMTPGLIIGISTVSLVVGLFYSLKLLQRNIKKHDFI